MADDKRLIKAGERVRAAQIKITHNRRAALENKLLPYSPTAVLAELDAAAALLVAVPKAERHVRWVKTNLAAVRAALQTVRYRI